MRNEFLKVPLDCSPLLHTVAREHESGRNTGVGERMERKGHRKKIKVKQPAGGSSGMSDRTTCLKGGATCSVGDTGPRYGRVLQV